MYVRNTGEGRDRVRIPENYSGHAFRDPNPYGDMPPPTRVPTSNAFTPAVKSEEVHFSPVDDSEDKNIFDREEHYTYEKSDQADAIETKSRKTELEQNKTSSSIFSSLLPRISSSNKFPFGHGIGSEELLILALMLIIYLSDEADEELLILLGVLLFTG